MCIPYNCVKLFVRVIELISVYFRGSPGGSSDSKGSVGGADDAGGTAFDSGAKTTLSADHSADKSLELPEDASGDDDTRLRSARGDEDAGTADTASVGIATAGDTSVEDQSGTAPRGRGATPPGPGLEHKLPSQPPSEPTTQSISKQVRRKQINFKQINKLK